MSCVYSLCLLAARSADADQSEASEASLKNVSVMIGLDWMWVWLSEWHQQPPGQVNNLSINISDLGLQKEKQSPFYIQMIEAEEKTQKNLIVKTERGKP